jgi:hypothetical protein
LEETTTAPVLAITLFLVCVLASAIPAAAEPFVDLYLGAAMTQDSELRISGSGLTGGGPESYDTSFTAGGRVGYWFGTPGWLGVAIDASFFKPATDITVIPVSALLMLRVPLLKDDNFPHGRLQPYIGAGPGVFFSKARAPLDDSVDLGADVRGGLAFLITRNISVFAEYRFTHVRPEFGFDFFGLNAKSETTFDTHHAVAGVGFRF